jgi:hypothetical protein
MKYQYIQRYTVDVAVGKKKITTMRIDEDSLKKAHDLGLNVTKVCENALKEMISRIEGPKAPKEAEDCPEKPKRQALVGLPGFEPGSRAPEAQSLDQTSRQPLRQTQVEKPFFLISVERTKVPFERLQKRRGQIWRSQLSASLHIVV